MSATSRYAVWNNKGGVGKSFLAFALSAEYASQHPNEDVLLVDMCPQANSSEMILGGSDAGAKRLRALQAENPRKTVAGYIEKRLATAPYSSPKIGGGFVVNAKSVNSKVPKNLFLVAGDNLLEVQAQAIYQMAQLTIPENAWAAVHYWIRDLCDDFVQSNKKPVAIFIDCNPSFAIYTELAIVAADDLIVPFTADDSSKRAVENIGALLYGISMASRLYKSISFSERARHFKLTVPHMHTFIANRVTTYDGKPSSAFQAMRASIEGTVGAFMKSHPTIFDPSVTTTKSLFFDVPDYHSACIVASTTGTPVARIKPGLHEIHQQKVQLNKPNLVKYAAALHQLVDAL